MDKYNSFSKKSGSPTTSPNYQGSPQTYVFLGKTAEKEQIRTKYEANTGKKPLEKSKNPAYRIITVAKNSIGQNWHSELTKIRSRIFHGFFYACDKIRCVMTDCIEEPSGSPFPLLTVMPILYSLSPIQLALNVTVSQLTKETAHV